MAQAGAACLCFVNRDYDRAVGRPVGGGGGDSPRAWAGPPPSSLCHPPLPNRALFSLSPNTQHPAHTLLKLETDIWQTKSQEVRWQLVCHCFHVCFWEVQTQQSIISMVKLPFFFHLICRPAVFTLKLNCAQQTLRVLTDPWVKRKTSNEFIPLRQGITADKC